MSKYIDADKLVQDIDHEFKVGVISREWHDAVEQELNWADSADVVEVVRCKDCIYGIENGELCGQKVYLCSSMTNPNEFYGDFYCEGGERKETND